MTQGKMRGRREKWDWGLWEKREEFAAVAGVDFITWFGGKNIYAETFENTMRRLESISLSAVNPSNLQWLLAQVAYILLYMFITFRCKVLE